MTLDGLFRVKLKTAWLPTPFASFPFTSPPVRRRVPPDSVSTLPTKQRITNTVVAAADFSLEHLVSTCISVFVILFAMTLFNLS